jgi:hypothetical protein
MRRRMGGRNDHYVHDPSSDRSIDPGYLDDETEMQKAIEESKRSAQEYEARIKERYIYHPKKEIIKYIM